MPGSGKMADGKLDSYRSVKCELWVNISSILWCNDKRLSSRVPARLDSADPVVNWPLGKEGLGCSGAAPPDGSYTENCSLGVCTRLSRDPPPHTARASWFFGKLPHNSVPRHCPQVLRELGRGDLFRG